MFKNEERDLRYDLDFPNRPKTPTGNSSGSIVVGFRRFRETMEFCAAEFPSVSASSGVAEETDAGVAFSVTPSAGEGGRRSVSVEICLHA